MKYLLSGFRITSFHPGVQLGLVAAVLVMENADTIIKLGRRAKDAYEEINRSSPKVEAPPEASESLAGKSQATKRMMTSPAN